MLCDALIRRFAGLDPWTMCDGEWLAQLSLALWLEARDYNKQAQMIAALFGQK